MVEIGRDIWRSSSPTPLRNQGQLERGAQASFTLQSHRTYESINGYIVQLLLFFCSKRKWVPCFLQEIVQKIHLFNNSYLPFSSSRRIGRIFKCQKISSSSDSFIPVSTCKPTKYIQNKSTYSAKVSTSTQTNSYKYFTHQSEKRNKQKMSHFAIF